MFTLSCEFTGSSPPTWNVTGLSMGQVAVLSAGETRDGYLTYPRPTTNVARLNVDLSTSTEVIVGTCFQCVFIMIGGSVFSENGCITLVGELSNIYIKLLCVIWRTVYHVYFSFSEIYTCSTDFHHHSACKTQWCLIKYLYMQFSATNLDTFSIVMLCDGLVCSSFLLQSCQSTLLSCMWFLAFLISSEEQCSSNLTHSHVCGPSV